MIDEKLLGDRLHELADRDEPTPAPVGLLIRRGRRTRWGRRAAVAAPIAIAVVLGTLALTGTSKPVQRSTARTAVVTAPVSLALAAHTTEQTTYRVQVTAGLSSQSPFLSWDFAFDPNASLCYVRSGPGGEWTPVAPPCIRNPLPGVGDLLSNPQRVLQQLQSQGEATYVGRTGSGAAAVDTWTYSSQFASGSIKVSYAATATVNVATSHIQTVTFRLSVNGHGNAALVVRFTFRACEHQSRPTGACTG